MERFFKNELFSESLGGSEVVWRIASSPTATDDRKGNERDLRGSSRPQENGPDVMKSIPKPRLS